MAKNETKTTKSAVETVTTLAQLSAGKLDRAVQGLSQITEQLKGASDEYRELIEKVELKQTELANLDIDFKEKERQMKLDLQMRAKETAEQLVREILSAQGKTSIENTELTKMRNELETLKADFDKNVKSEVHKAVSIISERHESQLNTKELKFEAESATIKAQLATANDKVESLSGQISEYKDIIDKERQARIEEARARGGEKVTVNTTK